MNSNNKTTEQYQLELLMKIMEMGMITPEEFLNKMGVETEGLIRKPEFEGTVGVQNWFRQRDLRNKLCELLPKKD